MTDYILIPADTDDEDSAWCQEHGHTGFMPGGFCEICSQIQERSTRQ